MESIKLLRLSSSCLSFSLLALIATTQTTLHSQVPDAPDPIHVNAGASGTGDGSSWSNAFTNLQSALAEAQAGDQIWIAQGTYYPDEGGGQVDNDRTATFLLKSGVEIYGGFQGSGSDPDQRDPVANPTTLSGDIDQNDGPNFTNTDGNSYHILTGTGVDNTAVLDGFIFTAAYAEFGDVDRSARGGVLICDGSGSPTFANCVFISNQGDIGAVAYLSNASPAFTNCSFIGNQGQFSGAFYIVNRNASPTFTNCEFFGNYASQQGGAIYNDLSATPLFTNCSFQGNRTDDLGGAIYNNRSAAPTFVNSIIWNNQQQTSTTGPGASVYNNDDATPSFSYCLIDSSGGSDSWDPLIGIDGGNNIDIDPFFVLQVDPANAPAINGDLRLFTNSPAEDKGDDAANSTPTDLAGNDRILKDAIDLGAYERADPVGNLLIIYVDQRAAGDNDGSSWDNAFTSLQDALATVATDEQIQVAEGTYYPDEGSEQSDSDRSASFHLVSGISILGGFPGGGGPISERDPENNPTILSGDIDQNDGADFLNTEGNSYHVVTVDDTDSPIRMDGFTLSGGNALESPAETGGGGVLCETSASLTIVNCRFRSNQAVDGGAIRAVAGTIIIDSCIFKNNRASLSGGAVSIGGDSPSQILNSAFSGNSAESGGAIETENSSLNVINCSIQGNHATSQGGAIYCNASSPAITNSIIWHNALQSSTSMPGASIGGTDDSSPTFRNCIVANSGGSLNWNSDLGIDNGNNIDGHPFFVLETDPADAPSASGDLRLQTNSPAVDRGDEAATDSITDLDGNLRIRGASIDIGAFELDPDSYEGFTLHVDADSGQNGYGHSWTQAFPNIQDALHFARPKDTIKVAQGTYYPDVGSAQIDNDRTATFLLKSGVSLFGGYASGGDEFAEPDPELFPTILSGDIDQNDGPNFTNTDGNSYHILTGTGVDSSAVLDGFIFTAANAESSEVDRSGRGGVLICDGSGSPTFANCVFISNQGDIGAVAYLSNASPAFTNCSFIGNQGQFSGTFYIVRSNASPAFTNCEFSGNYASQQGGAIYNDLSATPLFTNCSFQGNRTDDLGGAIYNNRSAAPTFVNSIIWNNQQQASTTGHGASVYNNDDATPTFSYCLVDNSGGSDSWDPLIGINGGNNVEIDPLFILQVDPANAPATNGNLRLASSSPAFDRGLDSANTLSVDLGGSTRIQDSSIDLGAYEGFSSTFGYLFGQYTKAGDANGNGRSNYEDYARGFDPGEATAPEDDPSPMLRDGNLVLNTSQRTGVDDVYSYFQRSASLLADSWEDLTEEVDFSAEIRSGTNNRDNLTVSIPYGESGNVFYRQIFQKTPAR